MYCVICFGVEVRRGIIVGWRDFAQFGGLGHRFCKNEASCVFLFVFFLDFEEFGDGLGIVLVEKGPEVELVELGVFAGEDAEVAGEPVAEGV